MGALDRAIRDGDSKFIAVNDVYRMLKMGHIDKNKAARILCDAGVNSKNLVELWCRDLKI